MQNRLWSKHLILIIVAIPIIVGGTVIWIMNAAGTIGGSWATVLGPVFAALAVLLGLLALPLGRLRSRKHVSTLPVPLQKQFVQIKGVDLGINEHRGALLVKVKKQLRGVSINICRGFDNVELKAASAANATEREVDGRIIIVSIFPSLEPGNYTVYTNSREYMARVTIHAGAVETVDWQ